MKSKEIKRGDLLSTYLTYHNLTILPRKGAKEPKRDGMPFMPMLLMDAMNMLYEEYIAPMPLKHREKQLRTRWHEAYRHYMSFEFLAFSEDEQTELCNIMDDFNAHIHNEVEMFRITIMGKFMQYDTNIRLTLSAILACNALAQSAQIIYRAQRRKNNSYIESIEAWSLKLLNEYANSRIDRSTMECNLNKFRDVGLASKRLCNVIIEFAEGLCW